MNTGLKKVMVYTLTPQIMPRLRQLLSGFDFVAAALAQIYRAVGLLPPGHPYLQSANAGRFGINHVVAEAGYLLKKNKAQPDQIAVYWLLMIGLIILAAQIVMLGVAMFIQTAHAQVIGPATNFFITTNPNQDLAFILLDRIFGIPDLFNSCVSTNAPCLGSPLASGANYTGSNVYALGTAPGGFPWPVHLALRSALELYSVALLVIAAIILAYFVFAVVAETAESGTPFGRRFNKVWAPIRLVMAFGLLVPIANGLNSGQYIALYAAKFGSGFATNGWTMFANEVVNGGSTLLGTPQTLVANVSPPPVNTLLTFFALVSTCKRAYETLSAARGDNPRIAIHPYLINPKADAAVQRINLDDAGWDFNAAVDFYKHGNIVIRFGDYAMGPNNVPEYTDAAAGVQPICGEVTLPMSNFDEVDTPGAYYAMQSYYEVLLASLWTDATTPSADPLYQTGVAMVGRNLIYAPNAAAAIPTTADMVARRDQYTATIQTIADEATTRQQTSPLFRDSLIQYGWAGAGIWYNRIAQVNGSLVSAVYNLPSVTLMPDVMAEIAKAKQSGDQDMSGPLRYQPTLSKGQQINYKNKYDSETGEAMYATYKLWSDNFSQQAVTANVFFDTINAIFGTSGLFNIHANADAGIHPLAQLVAIGRSVMESAVRNLGFAAFAGLGGGIANILDQHLVGSVALAVSSFLFTIAMTGLAIGFVLYYIVPFLPFMYFFFAVGGWVKAIFEAMVGVPLWALAHLRIDGQGLPGDAAMGGYWLILEIFLRPILIIFGMIGSTAIFSAQATVLNEIWSLVTSNVAGFDTAAAAAVPADETGSIRYLRGEIDKLFFTVMYAIVIYMLGMSSFKMVDLVPNTILRWMGAGIQSYNESGEEAAGALVSRSFVGVQTAGQEIGGNIPRLGGSFRAFRKK